MYLQQQRLLMLFIFCAAFGAMAWLSDLAISDSRALLADVAPTISVTEDKDKCTKECTKSNGEKFFCGKNVKLGLFGKEESSSPAPDIKPGTCRTTFKDKVDGKEKTVFRDAKGKEVVGGASTAQLGGQDSVVNEGALPLGVPGQPLQESELVKGAFSQPSAPAAPANVSKPAATPNTQQAVAQPAPSGNPGSTPSQGIKDIANPGGPAPGSPAGTSRPTFSPSPALSGSPFSLGSLFGGGGSGSGGGGYTGQGGTIAYVPVNQYPGLTSPNFDTLGNSGITFPPPQRV